MAHETSKQAIRRGADRRYATRWFVGRGIDIGCGEDSLGNLTSFFPLMTAVRGWDLPDGDAMLMAGVEDSAFDFVHSSHCLEHLRDPALALSHWIRICREGGHIVVTVPDEDLYEQGVWPSTFNTDHKSTFTIGKEASWSPASVNVFDLLAPFLADVTVLKVELLDAGFQYGLPRQDQSRGTLSESAIEIVLRKKRRVAAGPATDEPPARAWLEHAAAAEREGRTVEARQQLQQALARDPGLVEAHMRLAALCERDDATAQAVEHLDAALRREPGHREAHIARGFGHLKLGDFSAGGEDLRWIWRGVPGIRDEPLVVDGAIAPDLAGRTVVLTADSGLGDALQFARYGRLLRSLGADVVLECQPALVRLLDADGGCGRAVALGSPLPAFAARAPMHDLIRLCGTTPDTIPAAPYLSAPEADVATWAARLQSFPGVKVGLVWAGNPAHVSDNRRSIDRSLIDPLLGIDGVTVVSLQKGTQAAGMIDWTEELSDMGDTAALIAALDLVVTVDSAVAHLAGALGSPVWLLNRFDGCWRWMRQRADSPWYPTLRQFRQASPGDWPGVIAEVGAALAVVAVHGRAPGRGRRPARQRRPMVAA